MSWWQIVLSVVVGVMLLAGFFWPGDGELQNDLKNGPCGGRSLK